LIALRTAWLVHQPARPSLAQALFLNMMHRATPTLTRHQFRLCIRSSAKILRWMFTQHVLNLTIKITFTGDMLTT
jgi:hypothetical protein